MRKASFLITVVVVAILSCTTIYGFGREGEAEQAADTQAAGVALTELASLRTATVAAAASPRVGTYVLDGGFRMDSPFIKNGEVVLFGGNDNYRGAVLSVNHNETRLSVEQNGTVTGYFSSDIQATISVNPSSSDCVRHALDGSGTGNLFPDQTGGVVVLDLSQTIEACLSTYPARISSQATFYFLDDNTLAFCMWLNSYSEVIRKELCLESPLAILKKTP